jgi:hypothetical protein
LGPEAWGGDANGPFVDGHENVSGENPWKPEFLEEVRIYTVFRFMDWGKTNSAVEAHGGRTLSGQRRFARWLSRYRS